MLNEAPVTDGASNELGGFGGLLSVQHYPPQWRVTQKAQGGRNFNCHTEEQWVTREEGVGMSDGVGRGSRGAVWASV